jgi:hypothetical protein
VNLPEWLLENYDVCLFNAVLLACNLAMLAVNVWALKCWIRRR